MDSLGDTEVEGTIRNLSYNLGLSHAGPVYFVNCSSQRIKELPAALAAWGRLHPQLPFAMMLQEANHKGLHQSLLNYAAERGWTVVPEDFNEVSSHGLIVVTNEDVLASEFIPFSRDRDGYRRGMLRVQLLVDDNLLDVYNTQTIFSDHNKLDDLQARQLNEMLDVLARTPINSKAVMGANLNLGPAYVKDEENFLTEAPATEIFENWLVNRLPAWWHWSQGEEPILTWNPFENSIARLPTTASSVWQRMRNRQGWTQTAGQLSHFFHSHSMEFKHLGMIRFEMADSSKCALPLPYGKDADESGNTHYLSDHFALESLFTFR